MKKLLVIIPLAGFLTGCTTFNKQDACAAAQTAFIFPLLAAFGF